ncbi:MAG TPA: hypothetical protein VI793_02650 [Anaerolineales bacterium]|nr:hypothetical protein [Anaerolineales bacterium]
MPPRAPKLYAITYEHFPQPGGEGYLDTEWRVFTSKKEAERYGQEYAAAENEGVEDVPYFIFKDVCLVKEIDGYRLQLIRPTTTRHRKLS